MYFPQCYYSCSPQSAVLISSEHSLAVFITPISGYEPRPLCGHYIQTSARQSSPFPLSPWYISYTIGFYSSLAIVWCKNQPNPLSSALSIALSLFPSLNLEIFALSGLSLTFPALSSPLLHSPRILHLLNTLYTLLDVFTAFYGLSDILWTALSGPQGWQLPSVVWRHESLADEQGFVEAGEGRGGRACC